MTQPALHPPAPPADVEDALSRIREHGGRVTASKRAVVALLFDGSPSLTAEAIGERLDDHDQSVVYRGLAQLEELGIAEHIHLGHGRAVYRRAGLPTVPVVCVACGSVSDLGRADAAAVVGQVAALTGITPDLTHFPLTGTCEICTGKPT